MEQYHELEHTADVGLKVYGETIEELFINGVKGLFHLISPGLKVACSQDVFPHGLPKNIIELESSTQEELLVHWLGEFIYIFFVKKLYPKNVKFENLTENNLRAEVEFNKYNKDLPINLEIKAATYHNLSIKSVDNIYQADVIFDV
jgi:SHS2 domain-containing protein